jgi:transposase
MGAPTPIRDDIAAEDLRQLARQESEGRVACRLLALANAVGGMSRERAARQAGMDRQKLRDWVIRFNAEGVEGLRDRPKSGRPPWLDEGQLAAFKALVLRGPDPERDAGVALVLPSVSAAAMQAMLDELSAAVAPGAHAVVLMDRAGWHIAKTLTVPGNLTPLFLPSYSPELNAIERVWLLSARALPLAPAVAELRRDPRRLLRGLERAARRNRPHPLPLFPRLGQYLMGSV